MSVLAFLSLAALAYGLLVGLLVWTICKSAKRADRRAAYYHRTKEDHNESDQAARRT